MRTQTGGGCTVRARWGRSARQVINPDGPPLRERTTSRCCGNAGNNLFEASVGGEHSGGFALWIPGSANKPVAINRSHTDQKLLWRDVCQRAMTSDLRPRLWQYPVLSS